MDFPGRRRFLRRGCVAGEIFAPAVALCSGLLIFDPDLSRSRIKVNSLVTISVQRHGRLAFCQFNRQLGFPVGCIDVKFEKVLNL